MRSIEKILLEFDPEQKNLLPALKKVSAAFGHVSEDDAEKIAGYFSLPIAKVFETVSFYDEIKVRRQPPIVIRVCSSANCALGGSFRVIEEIENFFKIKAGDDFNPKVRLEVADCLGRCGEGPVVVVNDKIYTKVTESSVVGILEEWT